MFLAADCGIAGLESIFHYAVLVIKVIQIAVPIALIIWGSIDLLKGIIAGDDKKISAARKPFIQRLISAVIVFLIPWIVVTVLNTFTKDANSGWQKCYKAATKSTGGTKVDSNPGTVAPSK